MTKTILAMGQSNAIGAAGPTLVANAHSLVWNNENNVSTLANVGTAFVAPNVAARPYVSGNGNFLTSTAAYLSQMLSQAEDVRVILVATSGLSVDSWVNSSNVTGPMWARMKAVLAAAGVTEVDAFLWHQGESDEGSHTTYAARFDNLLARLQNDGHITVTTPVVVGECSWNYPNINAALRGIAEASDRVAIATIGALTTIDGTHFADQLTPMIAGAYSRELARLDGPWKNTWGGSAAGPYFVTACGSGVAIQTNTSTKIPLRYMMGNRAMVNADGSFSPIKDGIWRFDMQGYLNAEKLMIRLLDDSARELSFSAWAGSADPANNNMMMSSVAWLRLHRSDKIWFGLQHSKGSPVVASDQMMRQYTRFSAAYIGED